MNATLTLTILVVDDTASERELLSYYLHDSGYRVISAENAREGLNKAIEHQPDIIVTDVVMPEISGFELCRNLRRHPITARIPILICTSKDQAIDRLWGMKQGAKAYLTKPFTKEQLTHTIQSLIS